MNWLQNRDEQGRIAWTYRFLLRNSHSPSIFEYIFVRIYFRDRPAIVVYVMHYLVSPTRWIDYKTATRGGRIAWTYRFLLRNSHSPSIFEDIFVRIYFRDRIAIVVYVIHYLFSPICWYFRYSKVVTCCISHLQNWTMCFLHNGYIIMMSVTAATWSVLGIDYENRNWIMSKRSSYYRRNCLLAQRRHTM